MRAPSRHQRGFTLIELLVVIVIIASLAGMATLSLRNTDTRHWTGEVQRLAHLLQLVADRALIDKAHYGVVFEEDRYQVVRYDSSSLKWQEADFTGSPNSANASRFMSHELPPNMRLEVLSQTELPGADSGSANFAPSGRSEQGKKKEKELKPQFAALSSGEVLPVEVAFFLMRNGEVGRGAIISYSSLYGMQLEWQADDY